MIYNNILEIIGNTPLIKLSRLQAELGLSCDIYAKLEGFNPAGSIKDRAALKMVKAIINEKKITEGGSLVIPTSGNTGIGICFVANALGYNAVVFMPESASIERQNIIKAYGATLILTPKEGGMAGTMRAAENYVAINDNSVIIAQFDDSNNSLAHYETTAKEIIDDLNGKVNAIVCGVGTGGTICGIAQRLKDEGVNSNIVAVQPFESQVLTGGRANAHKIAGIGANFIPSLYHKELIDEVLNVSFEEARDAYRILRRTEGFLCGVSAAAALSASIVIARKMTEGNIVVIFPDDVTKYLSVLEFWK